MSTNYFFNFLILFVLLSLSGISANAYTIGVSPNKLELNKGEHAQIILFNNNEISANYTIESELLEVKKEGTLKSFEHKKILVRAIRTGEEIVIVNFGFTNLVQAVSIKVTVFEKIKLSGILSTILVVIIGLVIYLGLKKKKIKSETKKYLKN